MKNSVKLGVCVCKTGYKYCITAVKNQPIKKSHYAIINIRVDTLTDFFCDGKMVVVIFVLGRFTFDQLHSNILDRVGGLVKIVLAEDIFDREHSWPTSIFGN